MIDSPTLLGTGVLLSSLCILSGCHHAETPTIEAAQSKGPAAPPLSTPLTQVDKHPWQTVIRSQGGLIADESAIVGAKVEGRVKTMAVNLGDVVRAGDVLVSLDEEDLRLQVRQAEAQLAQARAAVGLKKDQPDDAVNRENSPVVRQEKAVLDEARTNLARLKLLHELNTITQADIDTSAAAVAVAEARYASSLNAVEEKLAIIQLRRVELQLIQETLKQATIRAPFDGLVQERSTAAGSYLRVGDPVVTLVRIDPLRYRGSIPERHALSLKQGQQVLIHLDGLPEPVVARVDRISPTLEEFSRALTFEADLPNPNGRLRSGLFAEAEVVVDTETAVIAVPSTAITEFAGVEKVWLVRDGQASEVPVQTGRRDEGLVEILNGIAQGDTILQQGASGRSGPVTVPQGSSEQVGG